MPETQPLFGTDGIRGTTNDHASPDEIRLTPELALLLGKAFGQSPRFWLAQQAEHDLWVAAEELGDRLARISLLDREEFRNPQ